jgi:hypothetical protein
VVRRAFVFPVTLVALLSIAPPARGDAAANAAVAQKLFDEALRLMDRGHYAEACPKLARSQELAPSGGTLLNLGDCYEKNGQTASAWVSFRDAAARAGLAGMKQAQAAALLRADALAPKLVELRIVLEPGMEVPSGLEIKRDGVVVSRAEIGMAVPVDPGTHKIEARAPGYISSSEDVSVVADGGTITAVVHPLLKAPEAPRSRMPAADDTGKTQRTIGLIVAGSGLVVGAVGGFFGLRAFSTNDEALQHCPDGTRCDPRGLSLTDTARSEAALSTVLVAIGGGALVAGGVLFLTAGSKPVAVALGPTGIRAGASW